MSAITDKLTYASNGTAPLPTNLASQKAIAASSLSLVAATGWPTATAIHFLLYKTDTNGALIAGSVTLWKGTLSGTTVSNLTLKSGTDDIYAAGTSVIAEMAPTSAWADDLIGALITSHNQDGTMITSLPLTTPKITTGLNDSNGNKVVGVTATTSAVNQINVADSATGTDPVISATGSDSNVGLQIQSKGTGDAGFGGNHTGWVKVLDTWVYASATTFTIAGKDVTAMFPAGAKLKLTQTTVKYFYVVSATFSTNTTVTVTGGSDYSLANAAITAPFYSYESIAQGFPQWFNFSASPAAFASTTVNVSRFNIHSRICTIACTFSGASNGTTFTCTAPVASANIANLAQWAGALTVAQDNGSNLSADGRVYIPTNGTTVNLGVSPNSDTWTGSGTKGASFTLSYEV